MQDDYDIIIIGAGMVGASLALSLQDQPLRIGLIEAVPFSNSPQSYDARTTALSYGTRRIFEGMRLWDDLVAKLTPIKKIHVSDQGHFGFTHLDAAEHDIEAFGYVVENADLGKLFADTLATLANVELLCPARVEDLIVDAAQAKVSIDRGEAGKQTLTARLVVLADGKKSAVRERLGIETRQEQYGQSAIMVNITPKHSHRDVAYERFTRNGPLAFLPMSENRCAVIWTQRDEQLDATMQLDDAAFLMALQENFGWRLGRLEKVGKRHVYPLSSMRSQELVRPRLALIGNAAHTLHPIAGQGFNLGLRDVAVFAQVLVDALKAGRDPGDISVLNEYAKRRQRDQRIVSTLTNSLVRLFSTDFSPLVPARNAGMVVADLIPPFKSALVRQGMGLVGWQPRLARGLRL